MNRKLLILLLFSAVTLSAQPSDFCTCPQVWLESANPAFIRHCKHIPSSSAELYGGYTGGGFRSPSDATSSWNAGAKASTLVYLDKYSMRGSFGFDQFRGDGMCGSMFINPGFYPVDVFEFTPGIKTRQTYNFDGAVSVDMGGGWRLGGGMEFLSANIAKRKDVRHSNYRLDMKVAPGVVWMPDKRKALGINYIFAKNTERIEAEQIGTAETSYNAFIDKGLMYGRYGLWDGSGLHLDEDGVKGFPVAVVSNGAAVQYLDGNFFGEVEYLHSNGKVGEKQQVWFRFPEDKISFMLQYSFRGKNGAHYLRLNGKWSDLANTETVLEKVIENGVTTVIEHGANRIYQRNVLEINPQYEFVAGKRQLRVSAFVRDMSETASPMYPYIYGQDTWTYGVELYAAAIFGKFKPSAGLGWCGGFHDDSERTVSEASGVATQPFRLEDFWLERMDWLTAPQLRLTPSLRYSLYKTLYLRASGDIVKALKVNYLDGSWRCGARLSLEYYF